MEIQVKGCKDCLFPQEGALGVIWCSADYKCRTVASSRLEQETNSEGFRPEWCPMHLDGAVVVTLRRPFKRTGDGPSTTNPSSEEK